MTLWWFKGGGHFLMSEVPLYRYCMWIPVLTPADTCSPKARVGAYPEYSRANDLTPSTVDLTALPRVHSS